MNVGDTVTVRVHDGRDCAAKVLVVHEDGTLDVQIREHRPLERLARSDTPAPFTWRP